MSDLEHMKSLLKNADVYNEQGLYAEAREKYVEAFALIPKMGGAGDQERLRVLLEKRIRSVDQKIAACNEADQPPELSADIQNLIRNLFSVSETRERSAFEGAVALMRFGQYQRAVEEFDKLLADGIQPLIAARNIITCFFLLGVHEFAIERYKQWCGTTWLTNLELLHIRDLLKLALVEKGIAADLPFPLKKSPGEQHDEELEPEISMMTVEFEEGELKGRTEELKVTFQFSNLLSAIVPSSRRKLIDALAPDATLNRMGFYSPLVFFRGRGKVTSRAVLKHGPRKGDYLFDISYEAGR